MVYLKTLVAWAVFAAFWVAGPVGAWAAGPSIPELKAGVAS